MGRYQIIVVGKGLYDEDVLLGHLVYITLSKFYFTVKKITTVRTIIHFSSRPNSYLHMHIIATSFMKQHTYTSHPHIFCVLVLLRLECAC